MPGEWKDKILNVRNDGFEGLALEIFRFQALENPVYKSYLQVLGINPGEVNELKKIPFLPISFFKSQQVISTLFEPQAIFESSGTTGTINSRHYIKDLSFYEEVLLKCFESFYGPVKGSCILGLLPSYLERGDSSLVYMVNKLIEWSSHPKSGFYLNEYDKLVEVLTGLEKKKQRTILFGVSFALLDLAERSSPSLHHTTIIETGGMKGRRKEMIREELHAVLKNAFHVSCIHSEYGMTELLSQAYSKGDGIFYSPPWMKVLVRDEEDPFLIGSSQPTTYQSGIINIIDLANIYSCSFIATDDVGKIYTDGSFEVLGRMDNADIRGCSLMVV